MIRPNRAVLCLVAMSCLAGTGCLEHPPFNGYDAEGHTKPIDPPFNDKSPPAGLFVRDGWVPAYHRYFGWGSYHPEHGWDFN